MKTYKVLGDVDERRLGVQVKDETSHTSLTIMTPCCWSTVTWRGGFKVACNNCKKEYSGYTDPVLTVDERGSVSRVKEWLSHWLNLEREDLEVTIK